LATFAVKVAAAAAPMEGSIATATLTEPAASPEPAAVAAPAILHPPLPRTRPHAAPPPPVVNSREDICSTLAETADRHNLPLAFFGNLIYQESGLKPRVVSRVGARGIAQFMPGTARQVGLRNPFNPREALPASAKFLRSLLRKFDNNYGLAAAAYNAGPGRVARWLQRRTVLPKETRDYVVRITGQRAEHWRGIRGNRFGHRLVRRMPCSQMAQFAHANEETVLEKGVLHAVYMKLPRPHPLRVAGHFAGPVPVVSLTTAAHAEPTPAAESSHLTTPVQKDGDRVSAPVAAPAQIAVAAATESIAMPRLIAPSAEHITGSVTTVAKAIPVPLRRPEMLASLVPAEHADRSEVQPIPVPRARPLHETRHTPKPEKQADRPEKKSGKKTEKKAGKHADRKKRRA
jgi:hypothetical protein